MINPQIKEILTAEGDTGNLSIVAVTNAAYVQRVIIVFVPHTEDGEKHPAKRLCSA